ncbi:MAG TPA: hypothetical protein VLW44_19130 [Streptosporangiaceae bacterium]|nr:hypothetical protein [Streptosporangiaceae bacterium]
MNGNSPLAAVHDSLTAAKQSLTDVHMTRPVTAIVQRGRARRWRRRATGLAGAALVAGAAIFATTALVPASHPAQVQLTAWTVTRAANGDVHVSIRQLRDPARLQARLRADGVPASITYFGHPNPACRPYHHVTPPRWLARRQHVPVAVIARVITRISHGVVRLAPGYPAAQATDHFIIVPSALPSRTGVQINAEVTRARVALQFGLVHASPDCTGS